MFDAIIAVLWGCVFALPIVAFVVMLNWPSHSRET